jgi:hypothetical protein
MTIYFDDRNEAAGVEKSKVLLNTSQFISLSKEQVFVIKREEFRYCVTILHYSLIYLVAPSTV